MVTETTEMSVLTSEALLKNWQGHRRLTRRVIQAFPEDKLFNSSIGGMRPFSEMAWEFIRMAVPIVDGVDYRQVGGVQRHEAHDQKRIPAPLGRADRRIEREIPQDPATPVQRSRQGLWPVGGPGNRDDSVRNR